MARQGVTKYRQIQSDLDAKDIITCIHPLRDGRFQFIVNGDIMAELKKRESCNKRLLKLHKHHCNY